MSPSASVSSTGSPPPASTRSPRSTPPSTGPRRADLGAEAVARPERVQRIERRHDLRHRGRRQRRVLAVRLDEPPVPRSASAKPLTPPEPRGGEDRLQRLRRGRRASDRRRREPGRGPGQHRAGGDEPRLTAATPRARGARSTRGRASARSPASRPAARGTAAPAPRACGSRQRAKRRAAGDSPARELVARPRQHAHRHHRHDLRPSAPSGGSRARLSAPISQTKRTPG